MHFFILSSIKLYLEVLREEVIIGLIGSIVHKYIRRKIKKKSTIWNIRRMKSIALVITQRDIKLKNKIKYLLFVDASRSKVRWANVECIAYIFFCSFVLLFWLDLLTGCALQIMETKILKLFIQLHCFGGKLSCEVCSVCCFFRYQFFCSTTHFCQ